jgi:hypothetical protein
MSKMNPFTSALAALRRNGDLRYDGPLLVSYEDALGYVIDARHLELVTDKDGTYPPITVAALASAIGKAVLDGELLALRVPDHKDIWPLRQLHNL